MRILHVITGLRQSAGTSTFCGEVCNQLVKLGHDVTIAVTNPAASDIYPLDPHVRLVSIQEVVVASCSGRVKETHLSRHSATTTHNYNLVHIHALWSPILHKVSNWAHAHAIPVVWSTHGMTAPWALHHKLCKKYLPWMFYQKHDLKKAAHIHCTSDFEVEWNQALGFKKTFLAPLGTFLPAGEGMRLRGSGNPTVNLSPKPQPKILLFVGRIYPVKALNRLIEAFALAIKNAANHCPSPPFASPSNWCLRLVGPDQSGHMAELMSLCDRLGLSYSKPENNRVNSAVQPSTSYLRPLVQFVGPRFGANLEDEYAACTALALVSHTENFGATVIDALAHGKPVITSTKTPWKIVADKGCGWWVDNDLWPLAKVIQDAMSKSDAEMMSIGARGRQMVFERYTWSTVGKIMVEQYNQIRSNCR